MTCLHSSFDLLCDRRVETLSGRTSLFPAGHCGYSQKLFSGDVEGLGESNTLLMCLKL